MYCQSNMTFIPVASSIKQRPRELSRSYFQLANEGTCRPQPKKPLLVEIPRVWEHVELGLPLRVKHNDQHHRICGILPAPPLIRNAVPLRHLKVRRGEDELVLELRHGLNHDVPRWCPRQPPPGVRVSSARDGRRPRGAAVSVVDNEGALIGRAGVRRVARPGAEGAGPMGLWVILSAEDLCELTGELLGWLEHTHLMLGKMRVLIG